MLERIPEPELMDSPEQTAAYAAADFASSNQAFVDHLLLASGDWPQHGLLYDLGCGPADITIRLARALPGWQLVGVDGGANMLALAQQACREAGLSRQLGFRLSLLPDATLPHAAVDVIVSNSVLHHLPEPLTLWRSIRQLAKPGAWFQVMDLARPASQAEARAIVQANAADADQILQEDFYHSLLAAYTPAEIEAQLQQAGFSEYQLSYPSERHWLVSGRVD